MKLLALVVVLTSVCFEAIADEPEAQMRARELYGRGNTAYNLGDYDEAIRHLTDAYKAYPDPRLLFNLAQAYRMKRVYERALDLYRSYLRQLPDAANREAVESLIADVESTLEKQKGTDGHPPIGMAPTSFPSAPTVVSKIEEPRPWYTNTVGWTLVGGGIAAVGVGVGFFVSASSLEDSLHQAPESALASIRSDISSRRTIGTILSVVGGLGCAGGIAVFLWSPRMVTREIVPIRDLQVSLGTQSVMLRGRF